MHGASPSGARWRRRSGLSRTEIPLRIGREFCLALFTAEADLAAVVDHLPALGMIEVHFHAGDRIDSGSRLRRRLAVLHMPLMWCSWPIDIFGGCNPMKTNAPTGVRVLYCASIERGTIPMSTEAPTTGTTDPPVKRWTYPNEPWNTSYFASGSPGSTRSWPSFWTYSRRTKGTFLPSRSRLASTSTLSDEWPASRFLPQSAVKATLPSENIGAL